MFSKFQFKAGRYDNLPIPEGENATMIKYYALKMALNSKRISYLALNKLLEIETNKKN